MYENNPWYDKLPNEKLEVYEPYLRLFFETMYERQMIWKKRFIDNLPRPWTNDEIFRDNKFTNVYRELDHNSQWQIKNILLDDSLSLKDLIWKMMFFRFFNNPLTFTWTPDMVEKKEPKTFSLWDDDDDTDNTDNEIVYTSAKWKNGIPGYDEYDPKEYHEYLSYIRSKDVNPFTSAYLISSIGDRDTYYSERVLVELHDKLDTLMDIAMNGKTPEELIKFLNDMSGIGHFMAHEFYTDFTYIPRYTNRTFMKFGADDFTNVGPGSGLGCRLVYPCCNSEKTQKEGFYKLRDCAKEWLDRIAAEKGEPMQYLGWNKNTRKYYIQEECNITLHQIEMWLCEFQKYWKMIIGEGKQRQKFEPRLKELIVQ